MAAHFFDSSALVKRYVLERGSAHVASVLAAATPRSVYLARIAGVETVAAIARRRRDGSISAAHATQALAAFRSDFGQAFAIVEITEALGNRAMTFADTHPARLRRPATRCRVGGSQAANRCRHAAHHACLR